MVKANQAVYEFIYDLRDRGIKWKDISEGVKNQFGLEISEGNLSNMYRRYVTKREADWFKAIHIFNVYLRIKNKTATAEECNCSFYYVDNVLKTRNDARAVIMHDLREKVSKGLKQGLGFDKICKELEFEGIPADVSVVAELVLDVQKREENKNK